jgi:hypothetical protein
MNRREQLQRAIDHIFSTEISDSGSRLGLANMRFGMAKIHWAQEQLGFPVNATFISAPDLTVTRNTNRWRSGFGYGGCLSWGDGSLELMILDLKPNACGMLVGGLEELPDCQQLLEGIHNLSKEDVKIDGLPIQWDFGKSNHFIDLFRVKELADIKFPPYIFIMHFSGGELRRDTSSGMGLYWDQSSALQALMHIMETPFGPLRILTGSEACEYYKFYRYVDEFVKKRRLLAAQRLFEDFTLINNDNHQSLTNANQILLGCYQFSDSKSIYPIALRPDLPAYLVRGRPNFSPEMIENLGFDSRAKRLGVYELLSTINLLPHGGGYTFPHILDVANVFEIDGERYFELELTNGSGNQVVSNMREIPFEYRGRQVVLRALELGMAEPVAQLIPEYILKI